MRPQLQQGVDDDAGHHHARRVGEPLDLLAHHALGPAEPHDQRDAGQHAAHDGQHLARLQDAQHPARGAAHRRRVRRREVGQPRGPEGLPDGEQEPAGPDQPARPPPPARGQRAGREQQQRQEAQRQARRVQRLPGQVGVGGVPGRGAGVRGGQPGGGGREGVGERRAEQQPADRVARHPGRHQRPDRREGQQEHHHRGGDEQLAQPALAGGRAVPLPGDEVDQQRRHHQAPQASRGPHRPAAALISVCAAHGGIVAARPGRPEWGRCERARCLATPRGVGPAPPARGPCRRPERARHAGGRAGCRRRGETAWRAA